MIIIYERKFSRDLEKIKDRKMLGRIQAKVEEIEHIVQNHVDNAEPPEVAGMTKLQGYEHYYRVRVGDYRLGISIEIKQEDTAEGEFFFVRCLHRKDIYRYFP